MEWEGEMVESYIKFFYFINECMVKVVLGKGFDFIVGYMVYEVGGL